MLDSYSNCSARNCTEWREAVAQRSSDAFKHGQCSVRGKCLKADHLIRICRYANPLVRRVEVRILAHFTLHLFAFLFVIQQDETIAEVALLDFLLRTLEKVDVALGGLR